MCEHIRWLISRRKNQAEADDSFWKLENYLCFKEDVNATSRLTSVYIELNAAIQATHCQRLTLRIIILENKLNKKTAAVVCTNTTLIIF